MAKLDSQLQVIEFFTERRLIPARANREGDRYLHASNVGASRLRLLCSTRKSCHRAVGDQLLVPFCPTCIERARESAQRRQAARLAKRT